MGNNNVGCSLRLRRSLPFASHIHRGSVATINMKALTYLRGTHENAEVLYTVAESKCKLLFRRKVYDGDVNALWFELHDTVICSGQKKLTIPIFKDGTDLLDELIFDKSSNAWTKTGKNLDSRGGLTDTKLCLDGTANWCGLLVLECKNNYHERDAEAVTIAHDFVSSIGSVGVNRSSETTDIGFSVVTKIRRCDGNYDITVEGPERHPVFALLHMFDEVNRTGNWKPSMSPHFRIIQREHSIMFSQSDSEDDVVSLPPRLGNKLNAASIANDGGFRGHAKGGYSRCRNFYGFY